MLLSWHRDASCLLICGSRVIVEEGCEIVWAVKMLGWSGGVLTTWTPSLALHLVHVLQRLAAGPCVLRPVEGMCALTRVRKVCSDLP